MFCGTIATRTRSIINSESLQLPPYPHTNFLRLGRIAGVPCNAVSGTRNIDYNTSILIDLIVNALYREAVTYRDSGTLLGVRFGGWV